MADWNNYKITNAGLSLIAEAQAQGVVLTFTNLKTSSHDYSSATLETLTALEDVEQTFALTEKVNINNKVKLTANLDNTLLINGYQFYTYGLYANIGSADVLVFVATTDDPDSVPSSSDSAWQTIINSYLTISNEVNVTINVDLSANATQQYVQTYVDGKLTSAVVVTIPADDGTNYTEVLDPNTSAVMYYTIDITIAGMTDDFVGTNAIDYVIPITNGVVDLDLSDERAEALSQRIGAWSQNGSVKFAFREAPTIDIPVYIYGL